MNDINIVNAENEIKKLTQINNDEQLLDSLEMVVIKSYLNSLGLNLPNDFFPQDNTIKGWIEWLQQCSKNN